MGNIKEQQLGFMAPEVTILEEVNEKEVISIASDHEDNINAAIITEWMTTKQFFLPLFCIYQICQKFENFSNTNRPDWAE